MTAGATVVGAGGDVRERTRAAMRAARRADQRRAVGWIVGLAAGLVLLLGASILLGGSASIAWSEIPPALLGRGRRLARYVVFETRLPRALGAALSGAVFGLAGLFYQRVIRNPLATPDIIGISSGASVGAVAVIVLTPSAGLGVQLASMLGATAMIALVGLLSWRDGLDPYRVILIGIGMSAVASAATTYLLTLASLQGTEMATRWSTGSVAGLTWPEVALLAGLVAAGGIAAVLFAPGLAGISLGDDLARGLGTRVGQVRIGVLVAGAALAALTTSVVGPIAFVSLICGPIAARLVPRGPQAALTMLLGAVLVVGADTLAQNAPLISPVPTGVLTSVIGAPVFIWLMLRDRTEAAL
ncbi:MAG: iron ABC transporter permease [Micropruina sp.]|uniref:FecCD family ABC transporter permease n=1 Tax=Micropruina sp. TaxID=2737536 RepID=UPI0039E222FE